MIHYCKDLEKCAECPLAHEKFVPDQSAITTPQKNLEMRKLVMEEVIENPISTGIVFAGLCPGAEEEKEGIPFCGKSGQILREALIKLGIIDESFFINQVHCRPTALNEYHARINRDPTKEELKHCSYYFYESLDALQFKVIVALGAQATKALTGQTGIVKNRGSVYFHEKYGYIISTYHPSYILRRRSEKQTGPKIVADWESDLKKAKHFLNPQIEVKSQRDHALVCNLEELQPVLNEIIDKRIFSIDFETTSLNTKIAEIVGIGVSTRPGHGRYVAVNNPSVPDQHDKVGIDLDKAVAIFKSLTDSPAITTIAFNKMYEYNVSRKYGFMWNQMTYDPFVADMMLGQVMKLKQAAELRIEPSAGDSERILDKYFRENKLTHYGQIPLEIIAPYGCDDADYTFGLHELGLEQIKSQGMQFLYENIELPCTKVLADMEYRGVYIDDAYYKAFGEELNFEIKQLEQEIYAIAGEQFNIDSYEQLGIILYNKLGLPVIKKTNKTQKPATDEDALLQLEGKHIIIDKILRYKKLAKFIGTFIKGLTANVDGWLYPKIFQSVSTGRLAYSKPNLQNIPFQAEKRFRGGFIAPSGYELYTVDESQLELRILAHFSGDPSMLRIYREDGDIHQETGEYLSGKKDISKQERVIHKTINFLTSYGGQAKRFQEALRKSGLHPLPSLDQCQTFINRYFQKYPGVRTYMNNQVSRAKMYGYVESILGRRRMLEGLDAPGEQRFYVEHQAYNTPIQSSAADIIKSAMVAIFEGIKNSQSRMALQNHDEILFYIHPEDKKNGIEKEIIKHMENPPYIELNVPLKSDGAYVSSWMDK